eukprot:1128288-Prorocentrum_minimum.AAC.1
MDLGTKGREAGVGKLRRALSRNRKTGGPADPTESVINLAGSETDGGSKENEPPTVRGRRTQLDPPVRQCSGFGTAPSAVLRKGAKVLRKGGEWTIEGGAWTIEGDAWTIEGDEWTIEGDKWTIDEGVTVGCYAPSAAPPAGWSGWSAGGVCRAAPLPLRAAATSRGRWPVCRGRWPGCAAPTCRSRRGWRGGIGPTGLPPGPPQVRPGVRSGERRSGDVRVRPRVCAAGLALGWSGGRRLRVWLRARAGLAPGGLRGVRRGGPRGGRSFPTARAGPAPPAARPRPIGPRAPSWRLIGCLSSSCAQQGSGSPG